jgi:hypothetical protein
MKTAKIKKLFDCHLINAPRTATTLASLGVLALALNPTLWAASGGPSAGLDELAQLGDGQTLRVSSSDPDWRSGNGDARSIPPGETLVVADLEGPGVIHHIWFTIGAQDFRYGRSLTLRMYWDGHDEPAVESPIGDFFAVGHGLKREVDSQPVSVTSAGRAYNCYWAMPFAKHARITLSNDSKQHAVGSAYYYVDYEKVRKLPANSAYFHAQYRQEYPARMGQNYRILEAEGRGHYVGTVLSVRLRTSGWFGEGDDFFFIDGAAEPTLRGTGTEDYFCDAWGFREFNRPYYGVVQHDGFEVGDRVSVYRWHIQDPVRFTKSLKVEIEHKGSIRNDKGETISSFMERPDLFSSVAYCYQTGKAKQFTTLPPADERVTPMTMVEFEDCKDAAKVSSGGTKPEAIPSSMMSGGKQLLTRFTDEKSTLTVPFKLAARAKGIAWLRLGAYFEGGIWSAALDGKVVCPSVDLYSHSLSVREVRIGKVELDAGEHTLRLECKGRNGNSRGYIIGLDCMYIEDITPYAVSTDAK